MDRGWVVAGQILVVEVNGPNQQLLNPQREGKIETGRQAGEVDSGSEQKLSVLAIRNPEQEWRRDD